VIEPFRSEFNASFTEEKYAELQRLLASRTRSEILYRVCETPVFLPAALMEEMVRTGIELTAQLVANRAYRSEARAAIPKAFRMPGESLHPHFMTADFGLVRQPDGSLAPRLVEMQAFPSVFGFQTVLADSYREAYGLDRLGPMETYLGGLDADSYWMLLREIIVGQHAPENVVLLEVDPLQQKTLPDFRVHEDRLGIQSVDISSLVREGRKLLYHRDGRLVPIERIYNRAIVDEIVRKRVALPFDYREELDVEWAGHPNWYFEVSKFSVPFLDHPAVPPAVFLDEYFAGEGSECLPEDRSRWVFKPLYSFAGKGVQFDPAEADLLAIPAEERRNYLLQTRMEFEPVIQTPQGMTQAEVRILYVWPEGGVMRPAISLARLGRGLMMGVDHNRDKTWVGASAVFVC